MLFAEVGAVPMEGINGWILSFAVTAVVSISGNVWMEYKRRAEAKERKLEALDTKDREKLIADVQKSHDLELAQLRADSEHRKASEDRYDRMFDRVVLQNKDLMDANQRVIQTNVEQSTEIKSLMAELELTKVKLEQAVVDLNLTKSQLQETRQELQDTKEVKQLEINELKRRVQTLEAEVKSLELSRDAARRSCSVDPTQG